MSKYLKPSLIFSGLLLLLYYVTEYLQWGLHRFFPALILFFLLQSFIVAWILAMGERDRQRFPIYALSSVSLRFVTGVLLLIIFLIMKIPDLQALTLQFTVVYLSYMIFELSMVLSNLRRN
ncbi:MAG: hypothetical protein AAGA85_08585 [Bacteroidota bacterium]